MNNILRKALNDQLDQLTQFNSYNGTSYQLLSRHTTCETFIATYKLHQTLDHLTAKYLTCEEHFIREFNLVVKQSWRPKAKGLSIYDSNITQTPEFRVLSILQTVGHHYTLYNKAGFLKLQTLLNTLSNSCVLTFINKVVRIYDVNLGDIKPIAPHTNRDIDLSRTYDKSLLMLKPKTMICSHCEYVTYEPWDPFNEMSWLAQEQQESIIQVDWDEHHSLRGMVFFHSQNRATDFISVKQAPLVNNLVLVA